MPDTTFKRPDGEETKAYLAQPKDAPKGAIVVIQEWWGLNDQIRRICDRWADAGYTALAPDLYKGEVAKNADEAGHKMNNLNWGDAVSQNIAGALAHLRAHVPGKKVAVTGFCMGGALTILAAINLKIDAGICFYGIPPAEAADPSKISAPMILHFAQHDDWCTPKAVDDLEAKLKKGGVKYELHRYDAKHAFMNEKRPEVYDEKSAQAAWDRSVAFMRREIG